MVTCVFSGYAEGSKGLFVLGYTCVGSVSVCVTVSVLFVSLHSLALDCWLKGCEFRSLQEQQENFLPLELTLCADSSLIQCSFHPMVTAVAHRRPSHSATSAVGRSQLNMHTHVTQQSQCGLTAAQAYYGNLSGKQAHMQLIREHSNESSNLPPKFSQARKKPLPPPCVSWCYCACDGVRMWCASFYMVYMCVETRKGVTITREG